MDDGLIVELEHVGEVEGGFAFDLFDEAEETLEGIPLRFGVHGVSLLEEGEFGGPNQLVVAIGLAVLRLRGLVAHATGCQISII